MENLNKNDEKYLVAYLDILGFKKQVETYLSDSSNFILDNIKSAIQLALDSDFAIKRDNEWSQDINQPKIEYNQFSDCTCLAIPYSVEDIEMKLKIFSNFIHFIRIFNLQMLFNHLYIRGGISVGFHHADGNIIFSEALIKAYEFERNAIYPRILLDEELLNDLKLFRSENPDLFFIFGLNKTIISDWDGSIFINPFSMYQSFEHLVEIGIVKKPDNYDNDKNLNENVRNLDNELNNTIHDNLVEKIEEFSNDKHIQTKYIWLNELLNWNINHNQSTIKFKEHF